MNAMIHTLLVDDGTPIHMGPFYFCSKECREKYIEYLKREIKEEWNPILDCADEKLASHCDQCGEKI